MHGRQGLLFLKSLEKTMPIRALKGPESIFLSCFRQSAPHARSATSINKQIEKKRADQGSEGPCIISSPKIMFEKRAPPARSARSIFLKVFEKKKGAHQGPEHFFWGGEKQNESAHGVGEMKLKDWQV